MDIDVSIIKSNPYFSSLEEQDFSKLLQSITLKNLKQHEALFQEGDFADAFYIVKEGAIRITTKDSSGKEIVLARIGEGEFFGEQAFSPASSPRRQASAKAQVATVLYTISRNVFLSLKLNASLKDLLRDRNVDYIKAKLNKLSENIQSTSYKLDELFNNVQYYSQRSVVFFQGDPAKKAYILMSGEIELRYYDKDKRIKHIIDINPGQLFGDETLTENAIYECMAVAKQESMVVSIESKQDYEIAKHQPLFNLLSSHPNQHLPFNAKGRVIQFRSEQIDLPAITSIILLKDNQEVVCHQIIGADIFLASISNLIPTKTLHFIQDEHFQRELQLIDNKVIGMIDYGLWNDRPLLLDLIIEGRELTQDQQEVFAKDGHIKVVSVETESGEELICKCMRVTAKEIYKLIARKADLAEISKCTGATTICGGCRPLILEMIGTNAWYSCTVSNIISHNEEIKSFQFTPVDTQIVPYKPGQHLVIKANIDNVWIRRSYTLTSTPESNYYEITIKKEPKGLFSRWLFENANKNLLLYVAGPYGDNTLELANDNSMVCFMGGIGITPAIAFIRYLVNNQGKQNLFIDYSVSFPEQFILKKEFDKLIKDNSNIKINYRATRINGRLSEEEIKKIITTTEGCHVFVCGPKGLEKTVCDVFDKLGLPPERLHVEQFFHAGAPEDASQTINL